MLHPAPIYALPEQMKLILEQTYFEDHSARSLADGLRLTFLVVSRQRSEAIQLLRNLLIPLITRADPSHLRVPASRRNNYRAEAASPPQLAASNQNCPPHCGNGPKIESGQPARKFPGANRQDIRPSKCRRTYGNTANSTNPRTGICSAESAGGGAD